MTIVSVPKDVWTTIVTASADTIIENLGHEAVFYTTDTPTLTPFDKKKLVVATIQSGDTVRVYSAGKDTEVNYFAASDRYDIAIFVGGTMTAGELVFAMTAVRPFSFPASLTGSYGLAKAASTGTAVVDLRKNGVSFGTVTFTTSATGVLASASGASFAIGDNFEVFAPSPADGTLADVAMTFRGAA